jgi:metal-responsive CopG/Arc/MetJ family transcriptional regulator
MSSTQRAHIIIPADLLREIDAIVGPRGRSAFLLQTAREEVRRRKLLHFLEQDDPAWREQDHPELKNGAAAWVRKLRSESEARLVAANSDKPRKARKKR